MAFPFGAAIGALGTVVGAGLNYVGTKKANQARQAAAEKQMAFQKESAGEQMGFQERMSNTAYQRATQDMIAAGINPILAYNQGGASTPGGSSAAGARGEFENELAPIANSAVMIRRANAELEKIRADASFTRELAKAARSDNVGKAVEAKIDNTSYGTFMRYLQRANPMSNMFSKVSR